MRNSNRCGVWARLATFGLCLGYTAPLLAQPPKKSGSLADFLNGPGGNWPLILITVCGIFLGGMVVATMLKGGSLDDEPNSTQKAKTTVERDGPAADQKEQERQQAEKRARDESSP